ncbi:hypothetical protein [Variovorax saccharolyticus]|uniref:hypothetical protein n=1 Tax=Variovorax saccharolyticus TaxID=3053516 RepID=UPI0025775760|nr:hypothetical protein [Variovorax sp. J31P216]MDM0028330.1 hypothetical protein [Variovorax sp. J31P216]
MLMVLAMPSRRAWTICAPNRQRHQVHLRAKSTDEAALRINDLSAWLGHKTGVDALGRAVWSGLVGELQAGREAVVSMLEQLQKANSILQQHLKKEHPTRINIPAPEA